MEVYSSGLKFLILTCAYRISRTPSLAQITWLEYCIRDQSRGVVKEIVFNNQECHPQNLLEGAISRNSYYPLLRTAS